MMTHAAPATTRWPVVGADTYLVARGDGGDQITGETAWDRSAKAAGDALVFGAGIAASDV